MDRGDTFGRHVLSSTPDKNKTDSSRRVGFAIARQRLHHPMEVLRPDFVSGSWHPRNMASIFKADRCNNIQSKAGRDKPMKVTGLYLTTITIYSLNPYGVIKMCIYGCSPCNPSILNQLRNHKMGRNILVERFVM